MRLHTAFILPSRDAIWEQLLHALLVLFLTLLENTRQKKKIKEERVDFYSQFEKKSPSWQGRYGGTCLRQLIILHLQTQSGKR